MKYDHDHEKTRQQEGAQTVRAIFAAQRGLPMAKILNPLFDPAPIGAVAANELRRAIQERCQAEAARRPVRSKIVTVPIQPEVAP